MDMLANNKEKFRLSMNDIHLLLREAIEIIDKAAKETKSVYYLHAGTALGAIRHNDLIPWDEDADVIVPLPCYDKLVGYLKNKDLGKFRILYREKHSSKMQAKLVLKGQDEDLMCVDLFPLIGFPKDKETQIALDKKSSKIRRIYANKRVRYSPSSNFFKKILKNLYSFYYCFYSDSYLYRQFDKILYNCDYATTELVTNPCGKYSLKNVIPKSWYGTPTNHIFGQKSYPIPEKIDEYLRHYYKDYMKVPPKEEQDRMMNEPKYFIGTKEQYNYVFNH